MTIALIVLSSVLCAQSSIGAYTLVGFSGFSDQISRNGSNTKGQTNELFSYGLGIKYSYRWSRWAAEAGVAYRRVGSGAQLTTTDGVSTVLRDDETRLDVIEVPLIVHYRLAQAENAFRFGLGVSVSIPLRAVYEYTETLTSPLSTISEGGKIKLPINGTPASNSYSITPVQLSLIVNMGYEHQINDRFSLYGEVRYLMGLTAIAKQGSAPSISGTEPSSWAGTLNIGVNYRLGAAQK